MTSHHDHVCSTCRSEFACPGDLERNYDGFPEVICTYWDVLGEHECEDCTLLSQCDGCGEKLKPLASVDGGVYCVACQERN